MDSSIILLEKILKDGGGEAGNTDQVLWRPQYIHKGMRCRLGKVFGRWFGFAVDDLRKITLETNKNGCKTENECGVELHKYINAYRGKSD